MKGKMKGVLFTACLTLLALVVLSASFLMHQQGMENAGVILKLAPFDRISDEFSSAESGIRGILNAAGISVSVEGNTATISEPLPNPNAYAFDSNINDWEQFIEGSSRFLLDVNMSGLNETLPICISGARYYHYPVFGSNITRITNASGIANYSLNISVDISGSISMIWDKTEAGPNNFRIAASTDTGSASSEQNLDFSKSSRLSVSVLGPETYNITVAIGDASDPGFLSIENEYYLYTYITTGMTFSTIPLVYFPEQSINITGSQYNISRVSPIKIA